MPFRQLLCIRQQKRKRQQWWPLKTKNFTEPNKLSQQNYHSLLAECLKKGCLFEDLTFPADVRSIGTGPLLQKLPQKIQWKRPHELHKNPIFYSTNKKRLALCQGLIENCWFLAAVEALTFHEDILFNVVPQNQSFERKKYAGIFHFKVWHFGEWVDVVVDDRLPVNEAGQLVFLSSVYKNLFWGALLEKAYAKVCGSYEDLQIGQVSEALVDFTGGVNMTIKLTDAPPDLWDILTRATYSSSLMGCQTHAGPTRVLENGLVSGHAYAVTGIRKVTCKHGPENLVRLRNPWGKVEWKGDWSDSSGKWELLSPKEKILLRRNSDDGEFWYFHEIINSCVFQSILFPDAFAQYWYYFEQSSSFKFMPLNKSGGAEAGKDEKGNRMSLEDLKIHFVDLMICKLTPDLMSQEDGKKWMCSMQFGKWIKGSTAGGRLKNFRGSFWMNPQYLLKVLQGNGSKRSLYSCSVLVSLIQKHSGKHRNRAPHLHIGLSLYKVDQESCNNNKKLPPSFFIWNAPLGQSLFVNDREVTQDFRLPPGTYVVVPSTLEPHQESEFILRIFSRKHSLRTVYIKIAEEAVALLKNLAEDLLLVK
ncbi:hypothetical protein E2320_018765 [Naja naja]|nr:hypothetical protein E2320_018765 [Naja naja]